MDFDHEQDIEDVVELLESVNHPQASQSELLRAVKDALGMLGDGDDDDEEEEEEEDDEDEDVEVDDDDDEEEEEEEEQG